ncbi:acetyl-CoA carboxylase biotin carboxyl carrier protein subunit [Metabacillus halosaccharovorans]|uniref:acetyl-CoA carboxylase biotin carboxyl carrier protein subunit n=1 Tax=Metabacillus halosaccharovorans TaxID=930124 RepID=UPI001C1FD12E|nr:acetyl-CoA carboxylase biotin carboxyl carrier protein subunit [Metabacillus halosaccharovorans]MBU7593025.1 acetyl-CoA carboxylase biotin carboxyl carrier protein subunit [Metabacillus halosaccharovorans]
MGYIQANMAGSIWKILVKIDDNVEAGQEVVILESMKMEIPITADTKGSVKKILFNEGDFVNEGDNIIEIN